ncbi:MAG TPA: SRPBCC family protein [Solirubrobacterales bacterium]|nr:SRPBCC family protein [Solirubrobacterales bacterium]
MPRVSRRRRLDAPPGDIWRVVSDPYHLPRWWPRTQRVENVTAGATKGRKWTQVLETRDRRGVRADYRCVSAAENDRYVFEQLLAGTPFDRILSRARTEIRMQPEGDGTRVTLTTEQRLRGLSRLGGFMMRRAMGRTLNEALSGLEHATGGGPAEAPS